MNKKYVLIGTAATAIITIKVTFVLLVVLLPKNDKIIVTTNSGQVRGVGIKSYISDFLAFYSIPYAEPPVNELRFQAPVPVRSWKNAHDGTIEGPGCPAFSNSRYSENCLTLSIYTKDLSSQGKPVFVYLHGGALESGSAIMSSYGPHYFMQHDLIVVVIQFRLGMLGFLNLNMENAPGNMGLADAIEALRWTQANIHHFGGDPTQVTLGGLSSGGIMTHALLISPVAQGLFQKVIIQSGTALSYRFYTEDVQPAIEKTKAAVSLEGVTNEQLLNHLLTLSTSDILQITSDIKSVYPTGYAYYYPYTITQDLFKIIPMNPLELVLENSYQHLPMLIGTTSDEGIRLQVYIDRLDFVNDNFYMVVPTDLHPIDDMSAAKNETAQRIKEFYFGTEDLSEETLDSYVNLCTDSWYGHITDYLVRLQASLNYNASVYYYTFAIDGAFNTEKLSAGITLPGASHGDDNGYLWRRNSLADIVPDDNYSELSRERLVMLFANFIKTGDPTPEITELLPVKWETLQYPTVYNYLINNTLSLEQNPLRDRLLFWQRLYGWAEL